MKIVKTLIAFASTLLLSFNALALVPEGDMLEGVKPGPDGKIDVLLVFAHQDDESLYGGGTVIKLKKDPRVRVYVLCLCRGDWIEQAGDLGIGVDHLAAIRMKELETAAAVLQAERVINWTYDDMTIPDQDQDQLRADVLDVIDEVGAEIIITHDPAGITGHPDHIACSRIVTEAFRQSRAQLLFYPTLPGPIYKIVMAVKRPDRKAVPAKPDFDVGIKDVKRLKRMACLAHASQMHFSPAGNPAKLLLSLNREYWTRVKKDDD